MESLAAALIIETLILFINKSLVKWNRNKPEGVEKRSLFALYVENFSVLCSLPIEQIHT